MVHLSNLYRLANIFVFEVGVSSSTLQHCRKKKFRMQLHLTLINTIFKYCHASVNSDNVDFLYLENGNVDRPVLNNKPQLCFFSKNLF